MPANVDVYEILRPELRRGSLILAVLGLLRCEHYGYTLRTAMALRGVEIDEGALYPMLRRLDSQGLLNSTWREEDKRNKRFYRLFPQGEGLHIGLMLTFVVLVLKAGADALRIYRSLGRDGGRAATRFFTA